MKRHMLLAVPVLCALTACGQPTTPVTLHDTAPVNVTSSVLSLDGQQLNRVSASSAVDAAIPKEYHFVGTMRDPRNGDILRQYATDGFEAALKSGADIGPTLIIRSGKPIAAAKISGLPDVAFSAFRLDSSGGVKAVLSDVSKLPPGTQQVVINSSAGSTQVVGTGVPESTVTSIAGAILSSSTVG